MKKAWSILPDEWKEELKGRGLRPFRADQILQALYRDWIDDWDKATTLPKDLRQTMKSEFPLTETKTLGTKKLLVGFADGAAVETVLIPATGRFTQCISTQVGCAMGCAFCASGAQGVVRSLAADEIVAEYMAGRAAGEITNIVVMGMGEPFANYDETMRALRLINAGRGPNLGARHITLSTCGVVPGIERLAKEGIQFELSVSLHAPDDELRSELMPVNRKWPLDVLMRTCAEYTRETNSVDSLPEEGEEHERSEGCAEACPSEGYNLEDNAVFIKSDYYGDNCNNEKRDSCYEHNLLIRSLFLNNALENILGNCGSRNKKVGVRGADSCRKNSCHYEACKE